jgi:NAD(P)-dependent dehydrogenase (short-subunit alcohol dehydrogenase family)
VTWRRALEVNLTEPFVLIQAAANDLRASGRGSVINVSSIYGLVGPDWRLYDDTSLGNPAAYAASKGGLVQLTRWLATTLAPYVRVNAIAPGGVFRNTPEPFLGRYVARTPLGRMAQEEDIKGAVAYLASDLSAYVTGQCLAVDGGWTAW